MTNPVYRQVMCGSCHEITTIQVWYDEDNERIRMFEMREIDDEPDENEVVDECPELEVGEMGEMEEVEREMTEYELNILEAQQQ